MTPERTIPDADAYDRIDEQDRQAIRHRLSKPSAPPIDQGESSVCHLITSVGQIGGDSMRRYL